MTHGQWLAGITSILSALAIVIGARFVLRRNLSATAELRLTNMFAFGTGVLAVAVVLDFLPDAWDLAGEAAPWGILTGILLLWSVTLWADRKFSRLYSADDTDSDGNSQTVTSTIVQFSVASAIVLAISLSAHSLLEGAALAVATSQVSLTSVGFVIAMLLHKLPEGILWGLALKTAMPNAARANPRRIWRTLLIPAAFTLLGTAVGITLLDVASSYFVAILSAILCGALMFICFSELFPMLREHAAQTRVNVWFFVGVVVMIIPIALGMLVGD